MTERPYTDDDLRAEATRQHAITLMDLDFAGIGERMDGAEIPSLTTEDNGVVEGTTWGALPREDFDAAQRAIDDLLTNAADTSEWAVNLGADGLEPDEHALTWSAGQQPIVRVHFAFHPGLSGEARDELVRAVEEQLEAEMRAAAGDSPSLAELYNDTPPERL